MRCKSQSEVKAFEMPFHQRIRPQSMSYEKFLQVFHRPTPTYIGFITRDQGTHYSTFQVKT